MKAKKPETIDEHIKEECKRSKKFKKNFDTLNAKYKSRWLVEKKEER